MTAFKKYIAILAVVAIQHDCLDLSVCINHQTQFAIAVPCNSLIPRTENTNYGDYRTQFALRLPLDGHNKVDPRVSNSASVKRNTYDSKKRTNLRNKDATVFYIYKYL